MFYLDTILKEERSVMQHQLAIIGVSAITTAYKMVIILAVVLRWQRIHSCKHINLRILYVVILFEI